MAGKGAGWSNRTPDVGRESGRWGAFPSVPASISPMPPNHALRMPPDIRSVKIGDQLVVVIDDFLEHPEEMVEFAAKGGFEPYPGTKPYPL